MPRTRRSRAYAFAAIAWSAGSVFSTPSQAGAQISTRTLSRPEAEFREPFSQVSAVRELRNGRVLVTDVRDKIVQLVDLRTGSAVKVGREGAGPGEYGLPMRLFALPNDTTLIFDPINGRYLYVGPDGKPGATFRIGDDAVPSGAAEEEEYRESSRTGGGIAITRTTDQRGNEPGRNQQSAGALPFEEPSEWPAVKPAFGTDVFVSPTGEIWVPRNRKAGDETPVYDVFSLAGRQTARVVLPRKTRVIGFGAGTVYTLRSDDDDLQYLQRFRV